MEQLILRISFNEPFESRLIRSQYNPVPQLKLGDMANRRKILLQVAVD